MNREIEIQAIIKDPKDVENKLRRVGRFVVSREQTDKYFVPPQRDFFAKEPPIEYLRIRFEKDKHHLNYSFLHFDKNGWLLATDEYETLIEKPEIIETIFKKIGMVPKVTVVKRRDYFDCNEFEVTLDRVRGLGYFIEVEAKKDFGGAEKTKKACLDFLTKLNIQYEIKAQMGYPRMLYRKLKKIRNRG